VEISISCSWLNFPEIKSQEEAEMLASQLVLLRVRTGSATGIRDKEVDEEDR
jgi:hypothetical protein